MDEIQIAEFLKRPALKRLDDQAREELRSALRQQPIVSISDDVSLDLADFEKSHRLFSENVIQPVLKRFQERQNQKLRQERMSYLYKDAKLKMCIFFCNIAINCNRRLSRSHLSRLAKN